MQKKLIAVAIAGLAAAPAFAQTNVTVYGVAQLTVENVRATGSTAGTGNIPSKMRVTSNSSRLGFRGTEDLGNGLKAIFQYETSVGLDGSGTTLFGGARDSFVGVAGGFGTVRAGVMTTPFRDVGNVFDILGQETVAASGNLLARVQDSGGQRNHSFRGRLANSVKYDSPDFAGFSFSGQYGANEAKVSGATENATNNHAYGFGLGYGAGPFKVKYAYERRDDNGALGLGTVDEEATGHIFGGEWNFGMGRIGGLWQTVELEAKSGTTGEVEQDAWGIYAGFNLGNGELWANYVDTDQAEVSGVLAATRNGTNTDARQWGVGYNYNLSKRTKVYAFYTQLRNKAGAAFDYRETDAIGTATGADPKAFAVGLRHTF
jgi:predicted porin